MISLIKKYLRISDLFLVGWIIFGILIFLEQYRFIYYTDANRLGFSKPFFIFVIYFILMVTCLVFYLFFEHRYGTFKVNKLVALLLFAMIVMQIENIFLAPNHISIIILDIKGTPYNVAATFNEQVKCIHFFTVFFIIITIFIGIFIFPKRIKSIKTVSWIIYLFYLLALSFLIYSIVNDHYDLLFKLIFTNEYIPAWKPLICPSSVFSNPNAYGMFLEVGIYLSIINYVLTKRKLNIFISVLFYIHLLLTLCKAGILAIHIVLLLFILTSIILSFAHKRFKKGIVYLLCLVVFISLLISLYLYLSTNDKYNFLFDGISSFSGRNYIWYSSFQIISHSSFIHGYGYGIFNSLVANSCGHYECFDCPLSHNWFLAMLGEGGVFYIVPFVVLMVYVSFIIMKNIYKEKAIATIGLSIYGFFIHTFFEDNYYILISLVVLLLIINHINHLVTNKQP